MTNPRTQRLLNHLREPLHRNAYALVFNTGLLAVAGFLYWALAARLFSARDLGIAAALVSTITFLSGLSQLNLRPGMARFVSVAGSHAGRLVATAYLATFAVAVVASVVVLAGAPLLGGLDELRSIGNDVALGLILVLAVAAWTIFAVQDGVLIGLRRATWLPIENVIFSLAKLAMLPLLAAVGLGAVIAVLASWLVPMILAVIVVNILLFTRLLPPVEGLSRADPAASIRRIIPFLAGDYVASLLNLGYLTLPPVIVVAVAGPNEGGYFYVVWLIVTTLVLVPRQLTTSLVVEAARAPNDLRRHLRSTLVQLLRMVVPACFLVAILGRLILTAVGEAYAEAGTGTLAILAIAVIPYSANALAIGVLRVKAAARGIIAIEAALAGSTLALGIPFVARAGQLGLATGWLLAQVVVGVVSGIVVLTPLLRRPALDQEGRS